MPYIFGQLRGLIERGEDLPTLPTIVLELHRTLDNPTSGAADVARVIVRDPALAARLLRAANSAAFARSGTTTSSIADAVARMGLNQVRAVCMVLAVVRAFGAKGQLFDHRAFWVHSATVAGLTSMLWDRVGIDPAIRPEDAYVVGLLHDVGLLVLEQHFPAELTSTLAARTDADLPLWPIEEEELGLDHGTVAGLLIGRWSLPSFVADAIANHHHPSQAPAAVVQLAQVVEAAEALCWEAGAELALEGRSETPVGELLHGIGVPAREAADLIGAVPALYERAKLFMA